MLTLPYTVTSVLWDHYVDDAARRNLLFPRAKSRVPRPHKRRSMNQTEAADNGPLFLHVGRTMTYASIQQNLSCVPVGLRKARRSVTHILIFLSVNP